jgi:hypothetical protein
MAGSFSIRTQLQGVGELEYFSTKPFLASEEEVFSLKLNFI